MKKNLLFALLLCLFAVPISASDGTMLPDYENNWLVDFYGACDRGKTMGRIYKEKSGPGHLEVITMKSGDVFYYLSEEGNRAHGLKHYFFKEKRSSKLPKEFPEIDWLKKVLKASKNYYNFRTEKGQSDCGITDDKQT